MSILLDALRKTEQQQRPAPTIHDEDPPGSAPEPMLTWPMAAMMAVALIASGWAVWRQYEAPEGLYRPPVTLAPAQGTRTQSPGQGTGTQDRPAQQGKAESAQAKVQEPPAAAPRKPPAKPPASGQRTPVETYKAPAANTSTQSPPPGGNRTAAAGRSNAAANAKPGPGSAKQPPANGARKKPAPHIPEPIGYWELPDAVRANVPEIRYSVLVYDESPEGRFVLANGQRLGEGDELQPGVKVQEIRRDGVVFSYRLYRFLVER